MKILGSSVDSIDRAEDRERFEQLLTNCNIPRPKGHTVFDTAGALKAAADVGYPVMVRPSYVLGGRAMEIVYNDEELKHYMSSAVKASREHPVLVDHYLQGTEVEVDAICDGNEALIPGIMEHIERAGVIPAILSLFIRRVICPSQLSKLSLIIPTVWHLDWK